MCLTWLRSPQTNQGRGHLSTIAVQIPDQRVYKPKTHAGHYAELLHLIGKEIEAQEGREFI